MFAMITVLQLSLTMISYTICATEEREIYNMYISLNKTISVSLYIHYVKALNVWENHGLNVKDFTIACYKTARYEGHEDKETYGSKLMWWVHNANIKNCDIRKILLGNKCKSLPKLYFIDQTEKGYSGRHNIQSISDFINSKEKHLSD